MNDSRWAPISAICLALCALISGCGGTVTVKTPISLTVNSTNPSSGVAIGVVPTDVSGAGKGTTSFTRNYVAGTTVTLTAPATEPGGNSFSAWSGCTSSSGATCTVTLNTGAIVTAGYALPASTPTVTVKPNLTSITTAQVLIVTITVAGSNGGAEPTGTITLTSGSYASGAIPLTQGSSIISVAAGTLAVGTDTLTATYTPDTASTGIYNSATGTASVTVTAAGGAPAAPTGLTATAGDQQVALAWTASTGATSYNVKRSTTNGGPYTTVASPTTAGYTDTGLTNGTAYYYVVSAVDAAGESANSNQASATPTGSGERGHQRNDQCSGGPAHRSARISTAGPIRRMRRM